MIAEWPAAGRGAFSDGYAETAVSRMQNAVTAVRDLRLNLGIPPATRLKAVIVSREAQVLESFDSFKNEISVLARLDSLDFKNTFTKDKTFVGAPFPDFEIFVSIEGIVNPAQERERIQKKIKELRGWTVTLEKKLADDRFVRNAPEEIVIKEREKLADALKVLQSQEELFRLFQ